MVIKFKDDHEKVVAIAIVALLFNFSSSYYIATVIWLVYGKC